MIDRSVTLQETLTALAGGVLAHFLTGFSLTAGIVVALRVLGVW